MARALLRLACTIAAGFAVLTWLSSYRAISEKPELFDIADFCGMAEGMLSYGMLISVLFLE
jgi:hypothetical protein